MLYRSLTIPTLLAASVAVPYVASNAPAWRQQWNAPAQGAASSPGPANYPTIGPSAIQRAAALSAPPTGPGSTLYPSQSPIEGTRGDSLADVLRLDITKEWVYARWPRKSTSLAELDLYGIRVPLVTGTQLYDLAGSLTYYFGPDGRLRLISFRGRTGDTTQVVGLVTQRFGLERQASLTAGEQLFQVRRGEEVISSLRTRPAPVLWASSPHESFNVELDLQDPANARPLAQHLPPLPALAAPTTVPPTEGAAPAEAAEADKPARSGWKAFFPRRSVPAEQIPNLDHGNMYQ